MKNLFKFGFLGLAITVGAAACNTTSSEGEETVDSLEAVIENEVDSAVDSIDSIGGAAIDSVDSLVN